MRTRTWTITAAAALAAAATVVGTITMTANADPLQRSTTGAPSPLPTSDSNIDHTPPASVTHAAPKTASNGPISAKLRPLVSELAPGATIVSATDYPELSAGTVVATRDGVQYSITVQGGSHASSNPADFTLGEASDTVATTAAGSTVVTVQHAWPTTAQSALIRQGGTTLTISVTRDPDTVAGTGVSALSLKALSAAPTPQSLTDTVTKQLDNDKLDALAQ